MNQPKKCQQEASLPKVELRTFVRFSFIVLACSTIAVSGCSKTNVESVNDQSATNKEVGKWKDKSIKSVEAKVSLVIDYGDPEKENRSFDGITLTNGSTVLDLMNRLIQNGETSGKSKDSDSNETGIFAFQHKGSGETAFLESIDGIKNEGASGRNWMYYVNEEKAVVGFGTHQLNDGDSVAWKFKVQD